MGRVFAARALGLLLAGLLTGACGSLSDPPTQPEPTRSAAPTPTPNPNPTPTPVLGAPAPKPTPTPEASPSPSPSATPDPAGASGCGTPTPPELSRIAAKVNTRGSDAWVLDSTPLVGPDVDYCRQIGYTDGRSFCPVRQEGDPQRSPCELLITGRAADTGRPGPTWYRNGSLCTGRTSGCANHSDNQYLLLAFLGGAYTACGQNGVCGEVDVDR
ncbi:MAG TPA: hypothetical protein VL691_02750 [Vicinamibacteria bacterium]|nr:hypothetical protein [Vicinamibacteria bacterium]